MEIHYLQITSSLNKILKFTKIVISTWETNQQNINSYSLSGTKLWEINCTQEYIRQSGQIFQHF